MLSETTLAIAGFTMIVVFMYLIMSKRMSAMNALILIPIVFALALGFHDAKLGKMMFDGVKKVAPTGIMICFAILFFGVMIDAGLFDPVIKKILKIVHGDPMKALVLSQTVLSVVLPLPLVALVVLSARRRVMGVYAAGPRLVALAVVATALILALNVVLIYDALH